MLTGALEKLLCEHLGREICLVEDYLQSNLFSNIGDGCDGFSMGCRYFLASGGKRLRPVLTLLSARYGAYDEERIVPIAAALEMVHMASLIHDDIIDSADLRRGKPTISRLEGRDFALHLGAFLFARALTIIGEYRNRGLNSMLAAAGVQMCKGEIGQLAATSEFSSDYQHYFYNIKRKTAALFCVSCQAGATAAKAQETARKALAAYGHYAGMAYQIADDILDLTTDEKSAGKPVSADLQRGTVTLPVIYLLKHGKRATQKELIAMIKSAENGSDMTRIKEMLCESGAFAFAQRIAEKYIAKAIQASEVLPVCQTTHLLRAIALAIAGRNM